MKQRIDLLANVAIIVFVLIVGGLYVRNHFAPPAAAAALARPQLNPGDALPPLAGYDWHAHKQTLILAVKDGCHYCENSAPFYKRLADMEKSGQMKGVHVVAVFPDSADMVEKTLQRQGLNLDSIPSVDFKLLKVTGTPTAILTDQNGRVVKSWLGELKDAQQQELLASFDLSSKE